MYRRSEAAFAIYARFYSAANTTTRLRTRVVIEHLDTPFDNEGNARVIYLRYANAKELATVLTGVSDTMDKSRKKGKGASISTPVNIQADEASNALIITAPQNIFNTLQSIIRKLDIRRAQVLVEAIIAEISLDRVKELGVQWIVDGTPGGSGPVGVINLGSPSIGSIAGAIAADSIPLIPSGTTIGLGSFNNNSINFASLIRALESDTSSNLLSTPSILTLDNQEAEIVVGQNVPFLTGQYASTGSSSTSVNPFQTIQRQDVGLTLRVKPQINEGNAIQLEVSSINRAASTGTADIVTNKRTIKTVVMVDDGDTIVLGGLIDEDLQQVEEKVPFLGDIPVLGVLFRANSTTKVKRNLVVFLRPVIVRDAATHAAVTGDKYNFFRAQQLQMRQLGVDLLPDEEAPLLPDRFNALPQPFDEESGTSQH